MTAALQECVEVSGFIFPPADLSKFFLLVCTFHILKQAQEHREALNGVSFRTNVSSGGQNTAVVDSSTVLERMLPLPVTSLLAASPDCRYETTACETLDKRTIQTSLETGKLIFKKMILFQWTDVIS